MAYKSPDKIVYGDKGATFKEAFADARKECKKTFEWNGKSYGTALKSEKKPESPPPSTRDISQSPRLDDMRSLRDRAAKASQDANERRDIVSKQEQAKAADLTTTATGRAMMDKELPRLAQRVKDVSDTAKGYDAEFRARDDMLEGYKRGGKVKKYASGGSVKSASSRGDGIAQRGKTRGKLC